MKLNYFPPLIRELVNYSDFVGCQVDNSLANVAVNVFQSSVLQLAVILYYVGSNGCSHMNVLSVTNYCEIKI